MKPDTRSTYAAATAAALEAAEERAEVLAAQRDKAHPAEVDAYCRTCIPARIERSDRGYA